MDYSKWTDTHLEHVFIKNGAHEVSVWRTKNADKPLIVLVHGISGDHSGLIPLARELSGAYRVAIVELPGHGASDPIPLPDVVTLQRWFGEALALIEKEMGDAMAVCAHSFGCSAVLGKKVLEAKRTILLNPVPTPSYVFAHYSRMIMDSAHFWAHIYNWRVFILMRSLVLAKLRTREARRRIRWVGWHSQPSYQQVVYQAGLVDMILDGSAYRHVTSGGVRLVVCGMFDTTAAQRDSFDMEVVFDGSKTIFLSGGHLLPIESPAKVARAIREAMVH